MRRTILSLLGVTAFFLATSPAAHAEKRVALVIGIDRYDNLDSERQLKKAVNDAHAVGETLKTLGYDVIEADNLARLDFVRQWQTFLNRVAPGDETAFYFAGHGVEIGGLNFLLPRDVPRVASGEEEVLKAGGLSLADFLDQLRERKPQIALYVVDACRDNPFIDSDGRGIGGTRGLARVDPPSGTFVMFSAGAGETALDRLSDADADPDSVYTRALLPKLKAQGKSITDIARDVRREVRELAGRVNHVQTPAYYDEVVGDFCPAGCESKVAAVEQPQATLEASSPPATASPPVSAAAGNTAISLPAADQQSVMPTTSANADAGKPDSGGSALPNEVSSGKVDIAIATAPGPGVAGLNILPGTMSYKVNDVPSITIRSDSTCYLTLFDLEGQATTYLIVFPNKFQQDNLLAKDQTVSFPGANAPFRFRLTHAGPEKIVAICAGEKNELGIEYDFKRAPFMEISASEFDRILAKAKSSNSARIARADWTVD